MGIAVLFYVNMRVVIYRQYLYSSIIFKWKYLTMIDGPWQDPQNVRNKENDKCWDTYLIFSKGK